MEKILLLIQSNQDYKVHSQFPLIFTSENPTVRSLFQMLMALSQSFLIYLKQTNCQRSDVLGQLMPMVGKEWYHKGVTELFSNISKNGFQFIYLTARAIGQYEQTRNFLNNLNSKDIPLPEGPVFMSPEGLFPSFRSEIIYKKPQVFKITALRDIKNLFTTDYPFYCGFGNRDTDAIAYRSVGINMGKIFIINPSGELHQLNNTFIKSYPELNEIVEIMFPSINEKADQNVQEEFNVLNYWQVQQYQQNVDLSEID